MVKVRRDTEAGDAPAGQGVTTENTGSMQATSNAARRDASAAKSAKLFRSVSLALRLHPVVMSSALDTSVDGSQFLPVISDGLVRSCQQRPQLRLRQQVTLDLQD